MTSGGTVLAQRGAGTARSRPGSPQHPCGHGKVVRVGLGGSNLSLAAILQREFVACFAAFSTVCALGGSKVLHGVVFKAVIYL